MTSSWRACEGTKRKRWENLTVGLLRTVQGETRARAFLGSSWRSDAWGIALRTQWTTSLDGMQRGYPRPQQGPASRGEGIPVPDTSRTAEQYPGGRGCTSARSKPDPEGLIKPWYFKPVGGGSRQRLFGRLATGNGLAYAAAPEALKRAGGTPLRGGVQVIERGPDLCAPRMRQLIAGNTPERTTDPLG